MKKVLLVVDMQIGFINDNTLRVARHIGNLLEKGEYDAIIATKFTNVKGSSYIITNKKLSNIAGIFHNCYSLKEVNFGNNFCTENVTNSAYAFGNCSYLENIHWRKRQQFNNIKFINGMFHPCRELKQIDLRGMNFTEIESLSDVFYKTSSSLEVLVNNTFKEKY